MFDQKGQIRIVEAFLSIAVVFSAVLISGAFLPTQNSSKQGRLADAGTRALMSLDASGTLGNLIRQEDWAGLRRALDILLPGGVSFNLTIYDETLRALNGQAIQSTSLLGRETVSVRYTCVSENPSVRFFVLCLQLAWV